MSTTVRKNKCGCITVTTAYTEALGIVDKKDKVVRLDKKNVDKELCPNHKRELMVKKLLKKWIGHRIEGAIDYGVVVDFMWDENILYFVTDEDNAVPYEVYAEYLRKKMFKESGNDPLKYTEGADYSRRKMGPRAPMRRN
jgi:hypothetical protein